MDHRYGSDPLTALSEAIGARGDTDSIGAILGAWLGARRGPAALPATLIERLHDGPFGPSHLRALATCLAELRQGRPASVPKYSVAGALFRNLALYPVIRRTDSAVSFPGETRRPSRGGAPCSIY